MNGLVRSKGLLGGRLSFSVLVTLSFSLGVRAEGYVGNAYGNEGKYRIFEFTREGNPSRPITAEDVPDAAWPSAVRIGNGVHVFASVLRNGQWWAVRRWTSTGGADYVDEGPVLDADASEPYGIGPATVTYDGSIFRLYYLIREAGGTGQRIGLATSADGFAFSRRGVVYRAGPDAQGGLSVSYACSDDGKHYLFVHAYGSDLSTALSLFASSSSADGPFETRGPTIGNSDAFGIITGRAGDSYAQFTGVLVPGRAIVVQDGAAARPYIPREVAGSTVYLDRPLETSPSGAPFADILRNKADLNFAVKNVDGSWTGSVTGYGQFPGVLSEFTAPLIASGVAGPWRTKYGYFLSPDFASGLQSAENPEPIRGDASCSARR